MNPVEVISVQNKRKNNLLLKILTYKEIRCIEDYSTDVSIKSSLKMFLVVTN